MRSPIKKNEDHRWNPPRLTAQETVENAMVMADRFNRLFLRTLRQMRDLRRYSVSVTINDRRGPTSACSRARAARHQPVSFTAPLTLDVMRSNKLRPFIDNNSPRIE
ncbi:MAG TPA: hypothetical protein VFM05_09425 [Candidatus Saccharimonadales bacterium]|nr:hypothetical protein [Candidatus Saccharimonadales bacterium]